MENEMNDYKIGTKCVQAGYTPENGQPRQIPIIQSTTFKYSTSEDMGKLFDLEASGYFYTRLQNPTNDHVAAKIAAMEGGTAAMLTSSGQAANFFAIFNICESGDHIVASSSIYGGTFNLIAVTLAKMGITATFVSPDASEEELNAAVRNLLRFVDSVTKTENASAVFDRDADYRMAVSVAENSAVLLKNEKGVLPLAKGCKAVFLGEFAQHPRYQGGGSSHVNSAKVSCALEHAPGVAYAQGYRTDEDTVDPALEQAAVAAAADAEVAVIFAGLPERYESEGYDRTTLAMPENQNHLIAAVAAVQPNTVVVLHNGSAIEMPWVNDVPAVLELYLAGDGAGEAAVNLLYGAVNPSGKLAETFPRRLSDTPAYLSFPGERETSVYSEGVFVGYRYYDTTEADVLFPFGHGLSY